MSPIVAATLDWMATLHETTGEDVRRIVLPRRAHEMLVTALAGEPRAPDGDPITGAGNDGRVWLACCEIVADSAP